MKVILLHDVTDLGEEGDVLEVAPGYARNYLLPRQIANLFNAKNLALLEAKKAQIEKKKAAKRAAALSEKEKLLATAVVISAPVGENGKLFGSVSSATIAEELAKLDIQVERRRIDVPGHLIKSVGDYKVNIRLYGNETVELKLTVQAAGGAEKSPASRPSPAMADGEAAAPEPTTVTEAPKE